MNTSEEKNNAICDQLKLQQEEIERLRSALKDCQTKCREDSDLSRQAENKHLLTIATVKKDLEDSRTAYELMKIEINKQIDINKQLGLELNDSKSALFETNEKLRKSKQEVIKSKRLEQENDRLMKHFLVLGELNEMYKQNIKEFMTTKSSAYDYECKTANEAELNEVKSLKQTLDQKVVQLEYAQAKIKHLEEQLCLKESNMSHLKLTLENTKLAHKHECDALKEHSESLKRICQMFEQRMVTSQSVITNHT